MDAALGWIGQIWDFLVSLVPHMGLMPKTHGGVKFKRRGRVQLVEPGLYWFWPIVTDVVAIPVKRQTLSLETQTLTTKDDYTVSVSATIVYEIRDVVKALSENWDIDDTVGDIAQKSVLGVVIDRTFEDLRAAISDEVPKEIRDKCKKDLRQYGVLVKDAFLSSCCVVTAYHNTGSSLPFLEE